MISILKQPYDCSFSKNEMVFRVKSNQNFITPALYPSMAITVVAKPAAGNSISFEFSNPVTGDLVIVYVLAVPTVTAINQMPDSTFAGTLTNYATYLAEVFKNIPVLNAYYNISSTGVIVNLVSKSADTQLVFQNWTTSNGSTSFTSVLNTIASEEVERNGYEIKALVFFERTYGSNQFVPVASRELALDSNSEGLIDVQEIIHSEIENTNQSVALPDVSLLWYTPKNRKRFYVQFVEYWSDETNTFKTDSNVLHTHFGGEDSATELDVDPVAMLSGSKRFMTWWPSGKRNFNSQNDWLSWMNPNANIEIKVILTLYTNTGDVTEILISKNMTRYETITFQTGSDFLDLDQYLTGNTFRKYSFHIINATTLEILTEKFIFYKDQTHCERKKFIYFNSYGVPESFVSFGAWVETANFSRDLANRTKQYNLSRFRPQRFSFNTQITHALAIETQELKQKEAHRLQVLLASEVVYVYDNQTFTPVLVSTDSIASIQSNDYMRRLSFVVAKANVNEAVSFNEAFPALVINEDSSNFTFSVQKNGIEIVSYGSMKIYNSSGTLIWTLTPTSGIWSQALVPEGGYEAIVTVTDSAGKEYIIRNFFRYEMPYIEFEHEVSGLYRLTLGGSTGFSNTVFVDWGDGAARTTETISASTIISKTYAISGRKKVRISAATFYWLNKFKADNFSAPTFYGIVKNIDLSILTGVEYLELYGSGISDVIYVNTLESLIQLKITNQVIRRVDFGFHPSLQLIDLNNLDLSQDAMEEILLQLWKFRKAMPACTLILLDNPATSLNATSLSIANGTGEYAGEGLVIDYSWTITI